jgi:hypothetical protein
MMEFSLRHYKFETETEKTYRSRDTFLILFFSSCGIGSGDNAGIAGIVVQAETFAIQFNGITGGKDIFAAGLHSAVNDDTAFNFE